MSGYGGIRRRASFRNLWEKSHGGASPPTRIFASLKFKMQKSKFKIFEF